MKPTVVLIVLWTALLLLIKEIQREAVKKHYNMPETQKTFLIVPGEDVHFRNDERCETCVMYYPKSCNACGGQGLKHSHIFDDLWGRPKYVIACDFCNFREESKSKKDDEDFRIP